MKSFAQLLGLATGEKLKELLEIHGAGLDNSMIAAQLRKKQKCVSCIG